MKFVLLRLELIGTEDIFFAESQGGHLWKQCAMRQPWWKSQNRTSVRWIHGGTFVPLFCLLFFAFVTITAFPPIREIGEKMKSFYSQGNKGTMGGGRSASIREKNQGNSCKGWCQETFVLTFWRQGVISLLHFIDTPKEYTKFVEARKEQSHQKTALCFLLVFTGNFVKFLSKCKFLPAKNGEGGGKLFWNWGVKSGNFDWPGEWEPWAWSCRTFGLLGINLSATSLPWTRILSTVVWTEQIHVAVG